MQILKEETKQSLLSAALNEFQEKGFEKASMRFIAKSSGMTIGNIYNYYPNKQALFEAVVSNAYQEYKKNIDDIKDKLYKRNKMVNNTSSTYFDGVEITIVDLIKSFTPEMNLLFTGSKGSDYQYIREELTNISYEITKSIFSNSFSIPIIDNSYYDRLAHIIAETIIESICIVMRSNADKELFEKLIDHMIMTYSKSIKIAINNKGDDFIEKQNNGK